MAESGQQSAFISIYHKRVPVTAEMKIELHRMNSTVPCVRRCAKSGAVRKKTICNAAATAFPAIGAERVSM